MWNAAAYPVISAPRYHPLDEEGDLFLGILGLGLCPAWGLAKGPGLGQGPVLPPYARVRLADTEPVWAASGLWLVPVMVTYHDYDPLGALPVVPMTIITFEFLVGCEFLVWTNSMNGYHKFIVFHNMVWINSYWLWIYRSTTMNS